MIRPHKSPALGWILVYDGASPPGFGATVMPAFHVKELKLLAKAPEAEWRDVALTKLVFPGAQVVGRNDPAANRRRTEARIKRRRLGWGLGGGLRQPEPSRDDD